MSFQLWKDKEEVLRKNNLLQKNTSMWVSEDFVALLLLTLIHYQVRDRRLLKEGDKLSTSFLLSYPIKHTALQLHQQSSMSNLLWKGAKASWGVDQVCQVPEERGARCKVSFFILVHGSIQCIVLINCWTLFWWPIGQNLLFLRCFLQYDRLYVENEIYLYNEIEQRVERMIIGKKEVEVGTWSFSEKTNALKLS